MNASTDVGEVVSWVLQTKEIIALLAILLLVHFIMTNHIPFLLTREAERADKESKRGEQEAARHQSNHAALEKGIDKLDDTMRQGLDQIKDAVVQIGHMALSSNQNKTRKEGM